MRSIYFGSVGPSIDFLLFNAGLRQAQLEIAKAQFTEAAESYRSTVLRDLKEVQDELSSLRWRAKEYEQTTTAATAARKAADLSLTLYRDGAFSYLDVVTAQSVALDAEPLAIAPHTRQLVAEIGLMLALGGGWTAPPGTARAAQFGALSGGITREVSPRVTNNAHCWYLPGKLIAMLVRFSTIIYDSQSSLA